MPSNVPLATSSSSSWLDTTFGSLLTTTFDFGYTIQQHNDEQQQQQRPFNGL